MAFKITICGSMRFKHEMLAVGERLSAMGYSFEFPNLDESDPSTMSDRERFIAEKAALFMREHLVKIADSDAILVYNPDKDGVEGYIGANTLMEMAVAFEQRLDVFVWQHRPENTWALEVDGMHPIVLDGDLGLLDAHVRSLPRCVVSTGSALKLRAVSRGLRRAGTPVRVEPLACESGVSEQPMGFEETITGAHGRHGALRALVSDPQAWLVSVESGLTDVPGLSGMLGCQAIVIERPGLDARTRVSANVEFPRSMTDRIGVDYEDMGALVKAEYGQAEKDPYAPVTGGWLDRQVVLEQAVFEAAVQR